MKKEKYFYSEGYIYKGTDTICKMYGTNEEKENISKLILDCLNTQEVKIDWELDYWTEKNESLAAVKGFDSSGCNYEGIGIMAGTTDEILKVEEIELSVMDNINGCPYRLQDSCTFKGYMCLNKNCDIRAVIKQEEIKYCHICSEKMELGMANSFVCVNKSCDNII